MAFHFSCKLLRSGRIRQSGPGGESAWLKRRAQAVSVRSAAKGPDEVLRLASKCLSKQAWSKTHQDLDRKLDQLGRKRRLEGQDERQLLPSEAEPALNSSSHM